jgi:hypothetical protein
METNWEAVWRRALEKAVATADESKWRPADGTGRMAVERFGKAVRRAGRLLSQSDQEADVIVANLKAAISEFEAVNEASRR